MMDITHTNFEAELVNASLVQPVLLDIWAPWCGPCKTLGPVLEKLETDYAGRFKLAKLNADDEPEIAQQLSQMFGVRSIPFCVLFKAGQPADGFVGALPEAEVRKFLDKHVPDAVEQSADDGTLEGQGPLAQDDPATAIDKMRQAVETNPANDSARYDYLRALLMADRVDEARETWQPVASNPALDARLAAIGHWIKAVEAAAKARSPEELRAALATNKRDFDARFELAQVHFERREFTQAMDELLEILVRDKTWKQELARKTYISILHVMTTPVDAPASHIATPGALEIAGKMSTPPGNPMIDSYRRKLSSTLF